MRESYDRGNARYVGSEQDKRAQIALADKLEGALPGACHVERRRRGLFLSRRRVAAIEVRLGESRFSLRADPEITAERTERVHDMRTRTDRMLLEERLVALQQELARQADTSADARAALDRLLGRKA